MLEVEQKSRSLRFGGAKKPGFRFGKSADFQFLEWRDMLFEGSSPPSLELPPPPAKPAGLMATPDPHSRRRRRRRRRVIIRDLLPDDSPPPPPPPPREQHDLHHIHDPKSLGLALGPLPPSSGKSAGPPLPGVPKALPVVPAQNGTANAAPNVGKPDKDAAVVKEAPPAGEASGQAHGDGQSQEGKEEKSQEEQQEATEPKGAPKPPTVAARSTIDPVAGPSGGEEGYTYTYSSRIGSPKSDSNHAGPTMPTSLLIAAAAAAVFVATGLVALRARRT